MTETMLDAYVACALWSSLDYGRTDESGNNPPLDERYSSADVGGQLLERMRADCEAFARDNADDIEVYCAGLGYTFAQVGHDFWLTREGHGAGFWDRYYGEDAELRAACLRLADAAKAYGEFSDALNDGLIET
jgi:hypothetical protein